MGISFRFVRGNRVIRLGIPLLAVMPVPCVTVRSVSVGFGTGVSTSSSDIDRRSDDSTLSINTRTDVNTG